jgi:hypothetical protein
LKGEVFSLVTNNFLNNIKPVFSYNTVFSYDLNNTSNSDKSFTSLLISTFLDLSFIKKNKLNLTKLLLKYKSKNIILMILTKLISLINRYL